MNRGLGKLVLGVAILAIIWLVVLPRVSHFPAIRQHIQRNERAGINPDAMFYSELGDVQGLRLHWNHGQWSVEEFDIAAP